MALHAVAHGVEEVELRLRAEEAGIRNAGGRQVLLRLTRHIARVAAERLAGERVVDEELDVQRLCLAEGVDLRGRQVRKEVHVGLVDGGESADGGTVEGQAFLDGVLVESFRGDAEVLFGARDVREADVDELHFLVLDELHDLFGCFKCHAKLRSS